MKLKSVKKRKPVDMQLLIVTIILLLVGTIMVGSASTPVGLAEKGDPFLYLNKQLLFLVVGAVGMFFASRLSYRIYKKFAWQIYTLALIATALVFLPGLGAEVHDAKRWIVILGIQFQTSELLKLAVIIFVSHHLSVPGASLEKKRSYLRYFIILCPVIVVLYFQPHLSAIIIISITTIVILLVAGMKIRHFLMLAGAGIVLATAMILKDSWRLARVFAFLNPFDPKNATGDNYQIVQSLLAIGSGGWFGLGFGKSIQKIHNLPEPHNDFIFAIFAEEMGFFGCIILIGLFAFLIYRGYTIAFHAPDKFSSYVATGITTLIAVQVIMNILVVTSLMPVTGVSLPFISYGGASLVVLMISIGILLNISRQSIKNV